MEVLPSEGLCCQQLWEVAGFRRWLPRCGSCGARAAWWTSSGAGGGQFTPGASETTSGSALLRWPAVRGPHRLNVSNATNLSPLSTAISLG
jgi:hypothetical protein